MCDAKSVAWGLTILAAGLVQVACGASDPSQDESIRPGDVPGSGGTHAVGSAGSAGSAIVGGGASGGTAGSLEAGASGGRDDPGAAGSAGNGGNAGTGGGSGGMGGDGGSSGADAGMGITCTSTGGGKCPASLACPNGGNGTIICGCQVATGIGDSKKAILDAGASEAASDRALVEYMLASAMIETADMTTNYPLGDGKTGDGFNAGIAKQNWGMMRVCHTAWNSLRSSGYATSEQMNGNRQLDVQVYVECRKHFAGDWWAGHRNGSAGLQTPNTPDIQNFKAGEDWTHQMIQDGNHQCDDVRFWVNLPPK